MKPTIKPPVRVATTENLLKVTVTIGNQRFDEDLDAQSSFDSQSLQGLNDALVRNPGLFAKWAMLEARARVQNDDLVGVLATIDADIADVEGELYAALGTSMAEEAKAIGAKPPTKDAINARVAIHPRRRELAEKRAETADQQREAKSALEYLTVGRKTIEQKRDSLLAVASNIRQEMASRIQVPAGMRPPGAPGSTRTTR